MDLREQLDQAIGDGPPLPTPEQRLAAGRAAARRRRTGVAVCGVAAVVAVVLPLAGLGWSRSSGPDQLGPATAPSRATDSPPPTEPTDAPDIGDSGARALQVEVVDGVPDLVGHPAGVTIGPVVRGGERAFGLEVRLARERSFVLLLQDAPGWQIRRIDTAAPGDDLASWLRDRGWLPTGESS
jgi:hypothetical protein